MRTDKEFIDFLHKELFEYMFYEKLDERHLKMFHEIVEKWKKSEPVKKERPLHQYDSDRCWHCKWLNGETTSVGIECTNPTKKWLHNSSKYKAPSQPVCKLFERRTDGSV